MENFSRLGVDKNNLHCRPREREVPVFMQKGGMFKGPRGIIYIVEG